jgi:hypothetical protein
VPRLGDGVSVRCAVRSDHGRRAVLRGADWWHSRVRRSTRSARPRRLAIAARLATSARLEPRLWEATRLVGRRPSRRHRSAPFAASTVRTDVSVFAGCIIRRPSGHRAPHAPSLTRWTRDQGTGTTCPGASMRMPATATRANAATTSMLSPQCPRRSRGQRRGVRRAPEGLAMSSPLILVGGPREGVCRPRAR